MKVSIIIPVYNVEDYIERCLLSVLNQTHQDIEIILVDDCGQDKSMMIAEQVTKNHENGCLVRILRHQRNRGLSAARNTGIEVSSGEYVYFLDSDDEVRLDTIEALLRLAQKYGSDFVLGNVETVGSGSGAPILKLKNIEYKDGEGVFFSFLEGAWYVAAWNKLVSRSFLLKNNLFFAEGLLHEDILWSFTLAATAKSVGVCHDVTYIYHLRAGSISQNLTPKNIEHQLYIYQEILKKIEALPQYMKNGLVVKYIESMKIYIFTATITAMPNSWRDVYFQLNKMSLFSLWDVLINRFVPLKLKMKSLLFLLLPKSYCFLFKTKFLNK